MKHALQLVLVFFIKEKNMAPSLKNNTKAVTGSLKRPSIIY